MKKNSIVNYLYFVDGTRILIFATTTTCHNLNETYACDMFLLAIIVTVSCLSTAANEFEKFNTGL